MRYVRQQPWAKSNGLVEINQNVYSYYIYFFYQGIARTQSPTNKNYAFELPTFGVIVGVSQAEVQWKGLALEEPPSWSQLTSTPGKYEVTLSLLGTVLELNNFSFENFKTILLWQSIYLSKSIQYQYPFSSEVQTTQCVLCVNQPGRVITPDTTAICWVSSYTFTAETFYG